MSARRSEGGSLGNFLHLLTHQNVFVSATMSNVRNKAKTRRHQSCAPNTLKSAWRLHVGEKVPGSSSLTHQPEGHTCTPRSYVSQKVRIREPKSSSSLIHQSEGHTATRSIVSQKVRMRKHLSPSSIAYTSVKVRTRRHQSSFSLAHMSARMSGTREPETHQTYNWSCVFVTCCKVKTLLSSMF